MRSSKRLAAQEAQAALSDHGLELILREHKPDQLAKALIVHYKNTATCRIRSKEYPRFPIRLAAKLHKSADPPSFIIDTLCELSSHFRDILDPSECFDKLLAQMCIEALEEYAQESRRSFERAKGPNIVSSSSLLVRLGISSSTSANQPSTVITLAHQQRCLSLIPTIPSPKLLAIAIIPFNLKSLLSAPADPEPAGVLLIRRLFEHKNCKDAIFTLKFLGLERFFSMQQIIVPLLEMNYLKEVINLCKNDRTKGTEFLDFVNAQLSHKFVGGVEVVTDDMIASVSPHAGALAPMCRLYDDRRFQKELTNAAFSIIQDYSLPLSAYPFIKLGRQYASLCWILHQRAAQHEEEGDRSAAASENFDSMLEHLLAGQPVLARLTVRKLVNMEDEDGARRFAHKFGIEGFLDSYIATPEDGRRMGHISIPPHYAVQAPKKSYNTKKAQRAAADKLEPYVLPSGIEVRFVKNREELAEVAEALRGAQVCGMDTEWLPQILFEDLNPQRTAIMQIACDDKVVFLMDMVALIGEREGQARAKESEEQGQDVNIRQETEKVLKEFFEDENVLKLGYEFKGDQTLLAHSFPILSSNVTPLLNFLDLKDVYALVDDPNNPTKVDRIPGGLAGLVAHYLKKKLNKKQQVSNWERRPLSDQQKMYAASDAYCLIEVYRLLSKEKHPVLTRAIRGTERIKAEAWLKELRGF